MRLAIPGRIKPRPKIPPHIHIASATKNRRLPLRSRRFALFLLVLVGVVAFCFCPSPQNPSRFPIPEPPKYSQSALAASEGRIITKRKHDGVYLAMVHPHVHVDDSDPYIACATNARRTVWNRTNLYAHEGCWFFDVGYIYISEQRIIAKRMFITFAQKRHIQPFERHIRQPSVVDPDSSPSARTPSTSCRGSSTI